MLTSLVGGLGVARSPTSTKKNSPHSNLRSQPSPPMESPTHLRHVWRQLNKALPPHPAYIARAKPFTPCHRSASSRPFHTTPTRSARPRQSPNVRAANSSKIPANHSLPLTAKDGQRLDRDGFWWAMIGRDHVPQLELFRPVAPAIYNSALQIGMIPPGVSLATYINVCEQLIKAAHSEYAGAYNIKTISTGMCRGIRMNARLCRD